MNMQKKSMMRLLPLAGFLALGACTVMPTGPSVMALPGNGQSIERFRADDVYCRQFAHTQIGGKTAEEAAQKSAVTSAAVGTAVGALAGVAIGGDSRGAAIGAGTGLLLGTAAGTDAARASGVGTQRQYDNAYVQCMYAQGHRVPVPASMATPRAVAAPATAVRADDAGIPPPPPGLPPPPPTR